MAQHLWLWKLERPEALVASLGGPRPAKLFLAAGAPLHNSLARRPDWGHPLTCMHTHSSGQNHMGRVSTVTHVTDRRRHPLAEDWRKRPFRGPPRLEGPGSPLRKGSPGSSQAGPRRKAVIMQWGTWDGLGWARACFIWRGPVAPSADVVASQVSEGLYRGVL